MTTHFGGTPMGITTAPIKETEASILARVLCDEQDQLPPDLARYILDREFSDRDKARMHELAVRNQKGTLSPAEKEILFAFANAGSVLSILKSKARRALNVKLKGHATS
jgi:hypothetical protein